MVFLAPEYPPPHGRGSPRYGALFAEVAELNGLFLELLTRLTPEPPAGWSLLGLPAGLAGRLVALPAVQRRELALCPYTLFSLREADQQFWRSVAERQVPEPPPAPAEPAALRKASLSLTVAALGCAWQLCRWSSRLAGLTFGLTPPVREALVRTPLTFLHRVVAHNPALIRTRLGSHACFWPDLIGAADGGTRVQLDAARLAGLHLIAAPP